MPFVTLGKTMLTVEKNGFGALPIQRVASFEDAKRMLLSALDAGITYFDTARMYTDSEEKMGYAFLGRRHEIIIATKTHATDVSAFWEHLNTSLTLLKTDYIDIYQFHNPATCYLPDGEDGMYQAMLEAKKQGKIRHIGITNHRLAVAQQAVNSGCYDLLQFPFSYLAAPVEIELVELCKKKNVGFVCMKGMAGGLIKDSRAAYAFMAKYDNALPIWGVQTQKELDEFISYIDHPVTMSPLLESIIEQDKQELSGSFCRACGYCLPCPVGIEIPTAARMELLTKRAAVDSFRTPKGIALMEKIESCIDCRNCADNCPYGLDTPAVLRTNLDYFKEYLKTGKR